ncbi:MAG: PEGA domain-containing protein, partial [Acidobacteriota bacterium]
VIYSNATDADIYLDNQSQGKTSKDDRQSKQFELKPGRYRLRIEHKEYESYDNTVILRAGKTASINAELLPKKGKVKLTFADFDAQYKIKLDNQELSAADYYHEKQNVIIITALRGEHTIAVERAGHEPFSDTVNVGAITAQLSVSLKRMPAIINIESQSGARVYLNRTDSGMIPTLGKLTIHSVLPNGNYLLMIECIGYESHQQLIYIEAGKELSLKITLKPLPISTEFADNFEGNLNLWNAPSTWRAEGGLLHVQGEKGIGLPKDRYYYDLVIVFGLRLLDDRGAAWVVRAQDEKNFYLFYLNGKNGPNPNKFLTYICRDGVIDLDSPVIPPLPIIPYLEKGDFYRIRIEVKGNVIKHYITPGNTGEEVWLGVFTDSRNNFPYGSAGFATFTGEDFHIHGFVITPLAKP